MDSFDLKKMDADNEMISLAKSTRGKGTKTWSRPHLRMFLSILTMMIAASYAKNTDSHIERHNRKIKSRQIFEHRQRRMSGEDNNQNGNNQNGNNQNGDNENNNGNNENNNQDNENNNNNQDNGNNNNNQDNGNNNNNQDNENNNNNQDNENNNNSQDKDENNNNKGYYFAAAGSGQTRQYDASLAAYYAEPTDKSFSDIFHPNSLGGVAFWLVSAFFWVFWIVGSIFPSRLQNKYRNEAIVLTGDVVESCLIDDGGFDNPTYVAIVQYVVPSHIVNKRTTNGLLSKEDISMQKVGDLVNRRSKKNGPVLVRKRIETSNLLKEGRGTIQLLVLQGVPTSGILRNEFEKDQLTRKTSSIYKWSRVSVILGALLAFGSIAGAVYGAQQLPQQDATSGWIMIVVAVAVMWPCAVRVFWFCFRFMSGLSRMIVPCIVEEMLINTEESGQGDYSYSGHKSGDKRIVNGSHRHQKPVSSHGSSATTGPDNGIYFQMPFGIDSLRTVEV